MNIMLPDCQNAVSRDPFLEHGGLKRRSAVSVFDQDWGKAPFLQSTAAALPDVLKPSLSCGDLQLSFTHNLTREITFLLKRTAQDLSL